MYKLTLSEFSECCYKHSYSKFILSSYNQLENNTDSTIRFELEFNCISFSYNPNMIRLGVGKNYIRLEGVKYVRVDEPSVLGAVYTIIGSKSFGTNENCYTIVAR